MSIGTEEIRLKQKAKALADKVCNDINIFDPSTFKKVKYVRQGLLEYLIKELENRI